MASHTAAELAATELANSQEQVAALRSENSWLSARMRWTDLVEQTAAAATSPTLDTGTPGRGTPGAGRVSPGGQSYTKKEVDGVDVADTLMQLGTRLSGAHPAPTAMGRGAQIAEFNTSSMCLAQQPPPPLMRLGTR